MWRPPRRAAKSRHCRRRTRRSSRTERGRRRGKDGAGERGGRPGRPSNSRPRRCARCRAHRPATTTSSAQSWRRNGRAERMPRPCPRWSRASTRNCVESTRNAPGQLSDAVAPSPWRRTTVGAPGGPTASRTKVVPRPGIRTRRPAGISADGGGGIGAGHAQLLGRWVGSAARGRSESGSRASSRPMRGGRRPIGRAAGVRPSSAGRPGGPVRCQRCPTRTARCLPTRGVAASGRGWRCRPGRRRRVRATCSFRS